MAQTEQQKRDILADAIRSGLEVESVHLGTTYPVHLNDSGLLSLIRNPLAELRIKPKTVTLIINGVTKELPAPLCELPDSGVIYTPSAGCEDGACIWHARHDNAKLALERNQAFATAGDVKAWAEAFK